ncbi:hypothetical protein A5679_02055 [Mycobacterium scrofulaceum]|uniref:Uncharacterized protein n=1 Tax=Mycobacterium scrofulaceum TaxID=1783 RepID=A0A1A2USZ1_MYCSC|nr:hypothetical protein A5679_02055 [Mycobacterium scrofulaceum]
MVSGDYAVLTLIDDQPIDFGVTAAGCAGAVATARLIALADSRRRRAVARGRTAGWLHRGADRHGPSCRATHNNVHDQIR